MDGLLSQPLRGRGGHHGNTNPDPRLHVGVDEFWVPDFEAEALTLVMFFRGALWLLLLLLLCPSGAQGHRGATSPGQEDDEPTPWPNVQRLQEQLRTAGALSKRYWVLFSCTLWPDHCEDQDTPVPPLGKSAPRRRPLAHLPVSLLSTASCICSQITFKHCILQACIRGLATAPHLVQPLGTNKGLAALPPLTCPDFSRHSSIPILARFIEDGLGKTLCRHTW